MKKIHQYIIFSLIGTLNYSMLNAQELKMDNLLSIKKNYEIQDLNNYSDLQKNMNQKIKDFQHLKKSSIYIKHEITIYVFEKKEKQMIYKNTFLNTNNKEIDLYLSIENKELYESNIQNAIVNNLNINGQKNNVNYYNNLDNLKLISYISQDKKQLMTKLEINSKNQKQNQVSTYIDKNLKSNLELSKYFLKSDLDLKNVEESKKQDDTPINNLTENKPSENYENMEVLVPQMNGQLTVFTLNNLYFEIKSSY